MIRVGLVGAGPWAQEFHAPMLAAAPELQLAAVWARRASAAWELAGRYGATAAGSFDELLDRSDAVAFAVPPDVQPDLAIRAARAGKHLLLEKPVAVSTSDARALADAVDAAGVATLLMLRNRFGAPVRDFLAAVSGSTVRSVAATFVSGSALDGSRFATPWRVAAPDALLDLGPHALDLVEAAAGPVTRVDAARSGGVLHIATRHESGALGSVVLSAVTPGTDGPLTCVAITDAGRVELADPDVQPVEEVQRAICDAFVAAVNGSGAHPLDVHRAVALQELLATVEAGAAR